MFLFIIFLSYVFGCVSTVALLIHLYVRYGLYPAGTIVEQEQYQIFHPLPENDQSKNSAVDTVNYLCQFLFQEMKDTAKLRRYIMKKLNTELNELKNTRFGKLFIQDILIQNFSLGKECPIFSDIQLDRYERQEQKEPKLIKEFVAKVNLDYKDGFSVTLDITLAFNYKCQIFLKVKRIQGQLHLEFRHEPFSHWLAVFQDEPFVDFDLKAYLSNCESPQLAQIIIQQIRRIIRRKQTWPSYKIRYRPFFPTSQQSFPTEVLSKENESLIPGIFNIKINHCDRLSIPYEIFPKEKYSLSVFLTTNITEKMYKDYLCINRDQWTKIQFEFIPNLYKINIKEVKYMGRTELLIEEFDPIPNELENTSSFKAALEDKNLYLLEIQGQDVNTLFQINRFLKRQSSIEYHEKIAIVLGIPLLHSIQVRQIENQNISDTSNSIEEVKNSSSDDTTLIMMNTDCLSKFNAHKTPSKPAESAIKFDHTFDYPAGPKDQYLNVCLWCKPPLDYDVENIRKKLILLGYATVSLSEIVLDAHMSFKRETQVTLNFRSVYSSKSDFKKKGELSAHKGYDDNMTHGFVTINIKHQPTIARNVSQEDKRDELIFIEKDEDMLNEENQVTPSKTNGHLFEDHTFRVGTLCAGCNKKIWMKSGRQCKSCLVTVHKKCEEKFSNDNICTHEPVQPKTAGSGDDYSLISNDSNESPTVTHRNVAKSAAAAAAVSSVLDVTSRRSFRGFGHAHNDHVPIVTLSELSKTDEFDSNSSPSVQKRIVSTPPVQTSSKLVSAASSAYSKIREYKARRTNVPPTPETKKTRSSSDLTAYENIAEDDLQDIITKCLSDETFDIKSLEELIHERAIDHTVLYAKANELGPELFRDLSLEERRQKCENEINRLQQDIELQNQIRDETIMEFNNGLIDEHTKKKIQTKLENIEEKVQALRALTFFYCSGLKYCRSQMTAKSDENANSQLNDNSDEQ